MPPPPYIKEGRRGLAGLMVRPQRGIPTATRSRFPPFPSPTRRGKEGEEGKKEGEVEEDSSMMSLELLIQ